MDGLEPSSGHLPCPGHHCRHDPGRQTISITDPHLVVTLSSINHDRSLLKYLSDKRHSNYFPNIQLSLDVLISEQRDVWRCSFCLTLHPAVLWFCWLGNIRQMSPILLSHHMSNHQTDPCTSTLKHNFLPSASPRTSAQGALFQSLARI